MWIVRFAGVVSLAASAAGAPLMSVDSQSGERLFQSEGCVQCHSIEGKGGKTAPDLGKRIDRNYTPALLVSVMWNHAPTMWAAMDRQGIRTAVIDQQGAADLFAYFYAVRFFDKPGDAARGKRLFYSKHCSECHGIHGPKSEDARPVIKWESLGHPIRLAEAMWNHAANMRQAFADQKLAWPQITGQDLSDILVYLRNLPAARQLAARLETGSSENGQALFESKRCAQCHTGKLELGPRLKGKTLTDIAADMWDHGPQNGAAPAASGVGRDAADRRLPLGRGDSPGQRRSCGREERIRGEELRDLPQRSVHWGAESFGPPRRVLRHFHDLNVVAARPSDVERDGSQARCMAQN